jgi:branched-chain amino acid transport system ATP-binding protein
MRAVMGMLPKRQGSVHFEGSELIRLKSDRIARQGLGLLPRGARHLRQPQRAREPPAAAQGQGRRAFDRPDLHSVSQPEGAQRQPGHQAVGRGAADAGHRPHLRTGAKLLLLDEPTEGLAPVIVQQIGNTIRMLREQGFTILLVEQNFRFAATVADRHYVVEHGKVIDMIPNAAIEANREKLKSYLGV